MNFGGVSMANVRRYHSEVANDLAAATTYYDDISEDLGSRFRMSVRDRIEQITQRPESFRRIHEQLRAAKIDRFPYVVLFEYDNATVSILWNVPRLNSTTNLHASTIRIPFFICPSDGLGRVKGLSDAGTNYVANNGSGRKPGLSRLARWFVQYGCL